MFNAFLGADLHDRFQRGGVERLILAGLTSQTCVEGTGRHALEAGYHVTFLSDAVADFADVAHRAVLDVSHQTFGHAVITVDAFLDALRELA